MNKRGYISFLFVSHLDAVALGEKFELIHGDVLLATEVPAHKIFEFTLGKGKPTALDEALKISNSHLLGVFVLNAIEQAFKELFVLVLVAVLICVGGVKSSHQLAEFLFVDSIRLPVHGVPSEVINERIVKALFSRSIIVCIDWPG